MRPDPDLQKLLRDVLEDANSGELRGVFIVMAYADGSMPAYDSAYHTNDLDDLLLQTRSECIKARIRVDRQETRN